MNALLLLLPPLIADEVMLGRRIKSSLAQKEAKRIERVAKAIAQANMAGEDQKKIDKQWSRYMLEATAAIRAMRDE